jgi:hypothetical protein
MNSLLKKVVMTEPEAAGAIYKEEVPSMTGIVTHTSIIATSPEILDSASENMKVEANRLRTFDGRWMENTSSPVQPADLATSGFYYIGPHGRVMCAYCNGRVHNWVEADSPTRLIPYCFFVHPSINMKSKEAKTLISMGYSEILLQRAGYQCVKKGMSVHQ